MTAVHDLVYSTDLEKKENLWSNNVHIVQGTAA